MIAIEIPKEQLRDFCRKWKVTEFALFGSVTRPEEFRADSDVDVMVRFADDARWSLGGWTQMRRELLGCEIPKKDPSTVDVLVPSHRPDLGREVDLCERGGVEQMRNYLRRAEILETAVLLDVA